MQKALSTGHVATMLLILMSYFNVGESGEGERGRTEKRKRMKVEME